MITLDLLQQMFPRTNVNTLKQYVEPLITICDKYSINTPERIAMFLAQVGHESMGLSVIQENLNYRADRLMAIFPKYFRGLNPAEYAHNPEKIANRIYSNRMGNGPENSGDGYKYRGRGLIQLTGYNNYSSFADYMGMLIDDAIHYLTTPEGAVESAAWFWGTNNLNDLSDQQDVVTVTKRINGGTHGLQDRESLFQRGMSLLS